MRPSHDRLRQCLAHKQRSSPVLALSGDTLLPSHDTSLWPQARMPSVDACCLGGTAQCTCITQHRSKKSEHQGCASAYTKHINPHVYTCCQQQHGNIVSLGCRQYGHAQHHVVPQQLHLLRVTCPGRAVSVHARSQPLGSLFCSGLSLRPSPPAGSLCR
jgi:hypothetical protein